MNPRRQGFIAVDISEGAFEDEKECNTAIETILRQVEREHIKQNIPICGFGVTSCNVPVKYTPWGRKPQPDIIPEPYHIHTVFSTDAFASSVKIFREYLKKDYGEGVVRHNKILKSPMFWIGELETPTDVRRWDNYCINQGLHIRKITKACDEEFVKKYCIDFILTAEKANRRIGATQPLCPNYSHLLPEQIYNNLHSRKAPRESKVLAGGVDKSHPIFDRNPNSSPHKNKLILPICMPKTDDISSSAPYQAPFLDEVFKSNIIKEINTTPSNTPSLYTIPNQTTDCNNYLNPF